MFFISTYFENMIEPEFPYRCTSSQIAVMETGINMEQQKSSPEIYVPVRSRNPPITGGPVKQKTKE